MGRQNRLPFPFAWKCSEITLRDFELRLAAGEQELTGGLLRNHADSGSFEVRCSRSSQGHDPLEIEPDLCYSKSAKKGSIRERRL